MDLFRQAILRPGPPEDFALLTVQEAIKPQKQTKLVQDENQLLENILRSLLQELVAAAVQSGQKVMKYGGSIVDGESSQGQIPRLLALVDRVTWYLLLVGGDMYPLELVKVRAFGHHGYKKKDTSITVT